MLSRLIAIALVGFSTIPAFAFVPPFVRTTMPPKQQHHQPRLGLRSAPRVSDGSLAPAPQRPNPGRRAQLVPPMSQAIDILSDQQVGDIVTNHRHLGTGATVRVNWKHPDETDWTTWVGRVVVFKQRKNGAGFAAVVDWINVDEPRANVPRSDIPIDYGEIVFEPAADPSSSDTDGSADDDVRGGGGGGDTASADNAAQAPALPAAPPSSRGRDTRSRDVPSPKDRFQAARGATLGLARIEADQQAQMLLNSVQAMSDHLQTGLTRGFSAMTSAVVEAIRQGQHAAALAAPAAGPAVAWSSSAGTSVEGSRAGSRSPTNLFPPPPPGVSTMPAPEISPGRTQLPVPSRPPSSRGRPRASVPPQHQTGETETPNRVPPARQPETVGSRAAPEYYVTTPFHWCQNADGQCDFSCIFACERSGAVSLQVRAESTLIDPGPHRAAIVGWMVRHGIGKNPPAMCNHVGVTKVEGQAEGIPKPQCRNTAFTLKCKKRTVMWRCTQGSCHKTFPPFPGYWNPVGYLQLLLLYVGAGASVARAKSEARCELGPDAVAKMITGLCHTAMLINADGLFLNRARWTNMQWDETFASQRKHQRGARQRDEGILTFVGGVTVTEESYYDENGQPFARVYVLEGVIFGVPSKARAEQARLMVEMTAPGAEVTTDGARMYNTLAGAGRVHRVVNHRVEFVTKDGVHTNGIEGFWSCVKKRLRSLFKGGGLSSRQVALRYQLCCFLQNMSLKRCPPMLAVMVLAREQVRLQLADQAGLVNLKDVVAKVAELICAPSAKALAAHVADRQVAERKAREEAHKKLQEADPTAPGIPPASPAESEGSVVSENSDPQTIAFEAEERRNMLAAQQAGQTAVDDADAEVEDAIAAFENGENGGGEGLTTFEAELSMLTGVDFSMAVPSSPVPISHPSPAAPGTVSLNQQASRRRTEDTLVVGSGSPFRSHRAEGQPLAARRE